MRFDTKLAVVLDESLETWQRRTPPRFSCPVWRRAPELVGPPYVDGSGNRYLLMCREPILVFAADRPGLRCAYERAMARGVERLAIFTHDLFATGNDDDNRAAVAAVAADELDLAGLAVHADRGVVDKVLDRLRPHP